VRERGGDSNRHGDAERNRSVLASLRFVLVAASPASSHLCHTKGKGLDVLKYTFYRLLQLIPVWLLLSMVVFAIVHVLPGDAIDALVPAEAANDPAMRAALEKELGLSR